VNALNSVLVVATVVVAGVGPFVAVHIGGKAFDADDEDDKPEHVPSIDETTQIKRITDDPYMY
jgi:hypothetical protein